MNDYKKGICKWCDAPGDVFHDNGLCDDCDSATVLCSVCRCRRSSEFSCRHVFEDYNFEWRGAGVDPADQGMKLPFHRLLSAMGEDFTRDLKTAIKAGQFYTWIIAPLIGGGGIMDLGGIRGRDYGRELMRLGESERADVYADGYHWLASLYKRDTAKANRTTLAWIDQWLWPLSRLDHGNQ